MSDTTIVIAPARRDQLPDVQRLARHIWRTSYPGIITAEQIEYMLERGYALDVLQHFLGAPDRGLDLLMVDGEMSAFAAWYVTDNPAEVKLDRLYVLPSRQRLGLGARLIAHVAAAALAIGAQALVLNVNKQNAQAIRAYHKQGFAIRESVIVDIGGGFVMDDYVMYRTIAGDDMPKPHGEN